MISKEDADRRFWPRVIQGEPDECWPWTGYKAKSGYGQIGCHRKLYYTHRVAYEYWFGPIPNGLSALHRCDNPWCVNPYHLFLGTQQDNLRDMHDKQRHRHKVTEDDVREIRRLHNQGMEQTIIAMAYDLTPSSVHKIIHRKNWKHVV